MTNLIVNGYTLDDIWYMADLKFVFSNIISSEVKKSLPNQSQDIIGNKKIEKIGKAEIPKAGKIPLFYQHKIRVPKYEYF